ncbi:MAG: HD domain-containing protein [Oscillospiraceae bacterium]|nr:HD domain-containing protein [Oscillospiraceae bacterium]
MKPEELIKILGVAEKLKCNTRHCYTSSGRQESVAEHSWRIALMAMLLTPEFPEADMNKVIRMCLIHDLGEAFTGDIPAFEKTEADSMREEALYDAWLDTLPDETRQEFRLLLREMNALETTEARIYKALDKMEAVISHNESDISTWLPLEYDLQLRYGAENVQFSPYFRALKETVDNWTKAKIASAELLEKTI